MNIFLLCHSQEFRTKTPMMHSSNEPLYKKIRFYTIKLPFIYLAIPVGFIFEYLITFPYMVLCTIDCLLQKKTRTHPPESDIS
jgi:hypothetical protein